MNQETFTAVDQYLADLYLPPDPALVAALKASAEGRLPEIQVSPIQGKMLFLLAQIQNAKNILEIGTLGGYSTIWLARALPPGGKIVTLELKEEHARIARGNIERAGLSDRVEMIVAPAIQSLPKLAAMGKIFDFVFIDADKPSTTDYFHWSLKMSRPGSVIVVDNVVRTGKVIDAKTNDEVVQGVRRFHEIAAKEKRVTAATLQIVGGKGYDGFTIARVN